jgi:hypothetical protein
MAFSCCSLVGHFFASFALLRLTMRSHSWWEGYDPQELYAQNHEPSELSWSNVQIHKQWDWTNGATLPTQAFVTNFYDRTLDAINRYEPDLIYFDVTVLPFYGISDAGMKITTHLYNKNPRSVVFGKILSEEQRKCITWDVERGAPNEIIDEPWQTCNCIGGWHYNTEIYEKGWYKSADLFQEGNLGCLAVRLRQGKSEADRRGTGRGTACSYQQDCTSYKDYEIRCSGLALLVG